MSKAEPMAPLERRDRYTAANGTPRLTSRQRRRYGKKFRASLGFVPDAKVAKLRGRKGRPTPRQRKPRRDG